MFVAKLGFLLLCTTALAERTRLLTSAIVIADISPYLLTPTVLCSAQQGYHQRKRAEYSRIAPTPYERSWITRVPRKGSSSAGNSRKRRWDVGTGTRAGIISRESFAIRCQSPEILSGGSVEPMKEISRSADSGFDSYDMNYSTEYARGKSGSSPPSTFTDDIVDSKTHALDTPDTRNGGLSCHTDKRTSHRHSVDCSAAHIRLHERTGAACRARHEHKRGKSCDASFISSRGRAVSPKAIQPPLSADVSVHERLHPKCSGIRTVVMPTTRSEGKTLTHNLLGKYVFSIRMSRQQAVLLPSFRRLHFSRTPQNLCIVAVAACLQLGKSTRGNSLSLTSSWRQRPCTHRVSSPLAETCAFAFNDVRPSNAVSNVPLLYLSTTRYSSAPMSSPTSSLSSLSTTGGFQNVCRPLYTACTHLPSFSPSFSPSEHKNQHSRFDSLSACASSPLVATRFLSASNPSSTPPLCSYITITASTSFAPSLSLSSLFPCTIHCTSAPYSSHASSATSSVTRLPHPSLSLGSLLTPQFRTTAEASESEAFKEKLKHIATLVRTIPIVLFMKGTPTEPACGFSRVTYELLQLAFNQVHGAVGQPIREKLGAHASSMTPESPSKSSQLTSLPPSSPYGLSDPDFFRSINVLEDDLMREGVKHYSEWPTIPQLYVHGQFTGGADITAAMFRDQSLHKAIKGALVGKSRSEADT